MDADLKAAKPEEVSVNTRGANSLRHFTDNHPGMKSFQFPNIFKVPNTLIEVLAKYTKSHLHMQ